MPRLVRHIIRDLFYVAGSIVIAVIIVRLGTVDTFLESIGGFTQVGSLIAGMFFTSVFTAAPASVVLGEIALRESPAVVAAFGGIGAVVGDYILFLIVRQGLKKDVEFLISHAGFKRFRKILHTRLLQHILPLLGALVLASPLPDELGLAMLGFSKIDKDRFLLVSLSTNFIGIFAIGIIARMVAG